MSKLSTVSYRSGYELHPRSGLIGKLLDRIKPRYKFVGGYVGWVCVTTEGEIFTSHKNSGVEWTLRSSHPE